MSGGGRIFVTGPEVVRSVTGEQVDMERIGGPEPHGRRSGVVHVTTKDDESALGTARRLAALLGNQGRVNAADTGAVCSAISCAIARARGRRSSGGTTSLTSPPASASAASNTRPDRHQRSACGSPTS